MRDIQITRAGDRPPNLNISPRKQEESWNTKKEYERRIALIQHCISFSRSETFQSLYIDEVG